MTNVRTTEEVIPNLASNQYHVYKDIFADPLVITPKAGLRIIVQSWNVYFDGLNPLIQWVSPGVDTVKVRPTVNGWAPQGFPYFGCVDDAALTISRVSGSTASIEIEVFWVEV